MSGVATVNDEPASLLNVIARASRDPNTDVAKLEALLAMQERVVNHQARHEYNNAMAAVAGEIEPIKRDAPNPQFGKRYATLSAIEAEIRPVYSRHGFSIRFGTGPAEKGSVTITCTVAHRGGHSETLGLTAPMDLQSGARARTPVQAVGSTVSYLRRYLLSMAFNITFADDDDGEGTRQPMRHEPRPPPEEPRKRTVSEWLDTLADDLRSVESVAELDRILQTRDVKAAQSKLSGEALQRFNGMVAAAIERLNADPFTDNHISDEDRLGTP